MSSPVVVNGVRIEWDTINELVDHRARHQSGTFAMDICGTRLTYGELDEQTRKVAANLWALGVRKGDRVACFLPNRIEQILVWLGTMRIGGIWLPINAALIGNDLDHTIADASPSVLVVDPELRERVDALTLPADLRLFIAGEACAGYAPFADLLRDCVPAPEVALRPEDPAVILYTGGTTGRPKGALLPHFAWIAAGYRYKESYDIGPDDVNFCVLSLFHNAGLMLGIIGPMVCNIPTYIEPRFSVSTFWERVRETDATITCIVGTIMVLLMQASASSEDRAHRLRCTIGGLGQLPASVSQDFTARFGTQVLNLYSLSEGGGVLIIRGDIDGAKPTSNGRGWNWAEVSIRDELDRPVAAGETGEICLRPLVPHIFMSEYYNNLPKTLETFRNLWLHTGDLGHLDDDGDLFFTGRQAHFLRRRGENISVHEVEEVLGAYPGIRELAVIGVPSELAEDEVKSFIVPKDGVTIDPREIVLWCRARMAAFKAPRFVQFLPSLPRSATKMEVERHVLKALGNGDAWDADQHMPRK